MAKGTVPAEKEAMNMARDNANTVTVPELTIFPSSDETHPTAVEVPLN